MLNYSLEINTLRISFHRWVDFPETKGCSSVRRAFLERLATYDVVTWSGKTGLSPPFLARHGWRRVQPDVVECVFCRQLLSVKLPSPVCQKQCTTSTYLLSMS